MTRIILRSQIQVCLTPRPYFFTAWHYPSCLGKHYCVPGNKSAVLLEDKGYPDIIHSERMVYRHDVWLIGVFVKYFLLQWLQGADTQNLRVCINGIDFGATVAWPLTDIWKKRHSGSCPKSKARWQPDRSLPLQMPPPSMTESRLGTHTGAPQLISNRENFGQEKITMTWALAGVKQ